MTSRNRDNTSGSTDSKTIVGTTNQINVVSTETKTTLSTPQDIGTTSTPAFAGTTLTSTALTNDLISLGSTVGGTATPAMKIRMANPAAARVYTLPDAGRDDEFAMISFAPSVSLAGRTFVQYRIPGPLPINATLLYTCPAGKKAIMSVFNIYNEDSSGTTAITYYFTVINGSGTWQVTQGVSVAPAGGRATPALGFALMPGDQLMINLSAGGYLSVIGSFILVPSTSPVTQAYLQLTGSPVALYTCPVGKVAYGYSQSGNLAITAPIFVAVNTTGNPAVMNARIIKASAPGSPIAFLQAAVPVGMQSVSIGFILEAGDIIQAFAAGTSGGIYLSLNLQEVVA